VTGRPSLPIGTYGTVKVRPLGPKLFEAACRFRDADGETRRVKRQGASANAARNALLAALAERRRAATSTELGPDSRVREAAVRWFAVRAAELDEGDLAPRTLEDYRDAWRLHLDKPLGGLRLREATTARCEAWQAAMRAQLGPATVKRARTVLSGVLGYAARMGALPANPVRDLSPITGGRKRKPRAMTAAERAAWLEWMDTHVAHDPRHRRRPSLHHPADVVVASRALGDITRLMLGTGCRIGEAMALSWDEIDLDAGTVAIRWHIVRIRGAGLHRVAGAKSEAGDRMLRVPRWCVDMLMRRNVDADGAWPVFPDRLGGWRDPNLVMRWLRWSRDEAGFGWVTSHVFRQTVITLLDQAGLSTREVADHAGHSHVAQTHAYMARRVASEKAAEALEGLL
jgi:integrase